jgi:N-acetyl-anhydromuramyl-L-alanine amidase AmpD
MLNIDTLGRVIHPQITLAIIPNIEHGPMRHISGIIIHQTDGPTAQSSLSTYKASPKGAGAHFLIDKDGKIYQTASVYKVTWNVGKALKSRCLDEHQCAPAEEHNLKNMKWQARLAYGAKEEKQKKYPNRYPTNQDSIGIELVGEALPREETNPDKKIFETVTNEQNSSLKWLVFELTVTLSIPMTEIFRHPVVSYKNETEAATAKW